MVAYAKAKFIRMSARKVRQVIHLIGGKPTQQALSILEGTTKRAALVVNKLLRSAIANAKNKGVAEESLYVSKIFADEGPIWKRFRANAFGRGSRVRKRTCHITIELDKKVVASSKIQEAPKKKKPFIPEKQSKVAHKKPSSTK